MASKVTLKMLHDLNDELGFSSIKQLQPVHPLRLPNNPMAAGTKLSLISAPSESPSEIAKVKGALTLLSSDALRGQGKLFDPDGTISNDYWLLVVWSLASLNWSCGKDIAREWSQQSARYSDEGFDAAWHQYDHARISGIGVGSLYRLAQHHGWNENSSLIVEPSSNDSRYRLLGSAEINALQPIEWRIKHLLPTTGLAAIFGESGSGKSFLALDIATAIADGIKWFGFKTLQTPVVYVMLEGESGLRNRISAWQKSKAKPLPVNFKAVTQKFQLSNPQDVTDLTAVVPTGSVVFIDTLNRAAPTSDENSSKEMGEILLAMKQLQADTAGLVVIIHHTGKDTNRGMRGHSSLHAALDAAIEVKRTTTERSWSIAKAKDGEDGKQQCFRLERHILGIDSDGEEISSCTVTQDHANIFAKAPPKGAKQRQALSAIKKALASGQYVSGSVIGSPAGVANIKIEDAINYVSVTLSTTAKNKRTYESRRLIKSLIDTEHLTSVIDAAQESWCWVTP